MAEMKKGGLYDGASSETWDESKHPRDSEGKFAKKGSNETASIDIRDEYIGKSVGAKVNTYEIELPDGKVGHLAEGTYIRNKHVFAGKGTKIPIRQEDYLIQTYGGKKGEWAKVKGEATLEENGKTYDAEVHWYEEPSVGKVEWKSKEKL